MFDVGDSGIDTDGEEERPQSDGSSSDEDAEPMIVPWWDQQKTINDEPVNEAGRSDAVKEPRPEHRSWWYRPDQKINEKDMKDGQLDPVGDWPNALPKKAGWLEAGQPAFPGCAPLVPRVPDSPDRSSPPLFEVELTASEEDDDASVLELVIPMSSSSRKKSGAGHRARQWISRKINRNRKRPASSIIYLEATFR